jgi:FtsP/CotA-like multicopper oxidase with cupredoxin domain
MTRVLPLDRRAFMTGAAALVAATVAPAGRQPAASERAKLVAQPQIASFFGAEGEKTPVWAYGETVPGPVIRVKQGQRLSIPVSNKLPQATTVHWHGLRIDNAMDGVPYLTQAPIPPGATFTYDLLAEDAGSFWYHPHVNSAEQVGRGLSGALIVEEPNPPDVDRDLVWLLDDWRLTKDGTLAPFGTFHDMTHAGRLGNVATVNGKSIETFEVKSGERIRLRLINAANARVFGLTFDGVDPWRIAIDGHPVEPRQSGGRPIVVPPGGRIDLILDMTGSPGDTFDIKDVYYRRFAYRLVTVVYAGDLPRQAGLRDAPAPAPLPSNPVPAPDLANAEGHEMVFGGGAMGRLREAKYKGETLGLRELAGMGLVWAVNGRIIPPMEEGDVGEPMLAMKKGRTYLLTWRNDTAFDHPIHLHGHSFHVVARDGRKLDEPPIMDTVLIRPGQTVDVAFVADNPGDWALHCHVLEHAAAGMMGYVRVV